MICNKRNKIKKHNKQEPLKSGNKVVDDFIRYTFINGDLEIEKMKFVPCNQFVNLELIAEGGFSQIYKAIWIIQKNKKQSYNRTVALKKLNESKNITSKDLNEVLYNIYKLI